MRVAFRLSSDGAVLGGGSDEVSGCFLLMPDLSSGKMTLKGGTCLEASSVVH